jgi:hypothetical protein
MEEQNSKESSTNTSKHENTSSTIPYLYEGILHQSLLQHGWLNAPFVEVRRYDEKGEDGQFCWHWNAGRCGFGEQCFRAAYHHPKFIYETTKKKPIFFYLFK